MHSTWRHGKGGITGRCGGLLQPTKDPLAGFARLHQQGPWVFHFADRIALCLTDEKNHTFTFKLTSRTGNIAVERPS